MYSQGVLLSKMAAASSLQMHLQHSPRKKNFGYEETIRLLELWTHYTNGGTHPELGKGHRTGRLWLVISERMKAMNYNRGPEECKVRVGNLRAKYTKLKRGYLSGEDFASHRVTHFHPPTNPNQQRHNTLWSPHRFLCVYSSQFCTPTISQTRVTSAHRLCNPFSLCRAITLKCCLGCIYFQPALLACSAQCVDDACVVTESGFERGSVARVCCPPPTDALCLPFTRLVG